MLSLSHLAQQRLLGVSLRIPVREQVCELVVRERVEVVDVEGEVLVVVVSIEVRCGHGRRGEGGAKAAAAATA
jgi:hypothetical protein